jgi:hypothetical protein
MTHVLDGCFEKVKRAGEHIATFRAEADPADPEHPLAFEAEAHFHIEPGGESWFITTCAEAPIIPARWGILIGDVAHNLRSALDHLAWQLALHHRRGQRPSKSTKFPICTDPGCWIDKNTKNALTHLHTDHRTIIERHQPYKRGNKAKAHPLAVLARLSNTDKHQIVVPVVSGIADIPTKVIREHGGVVDSLKVNIGVPLEPGAELFRYRVTGIDLRESGEVDVQFRFDLYVAFEDRSRVDETLEAIQGYVLGILEEFKPLL